MGSSTEMAGFSKMNEGSVKWGMYEVMVTVVLQQVAERLVAEQLKSLSPSLVSCFLHSCRSGQQFQLAKQTRKST